MCVTKGCIFVWLRAVGVCGYGQYICVTKGYTCVCDEGLYICVAKGCKNVWLCALPMCD